MTARPTSTMRFYRVQALWQTCSRILVQPLLDVNTCIQGRQEPSVEYGREHFTAKPSELDRQKRHAVEQAIPTLKKIALQNGANPPPFICILTMNLLWI